jgi:hypothetical protein
LSCSLPQAKEDPGTNNETVPIKQSGEAPKLIIKEPVEPTTPIKADVAISERMRDLIVRWRKEYDPSMRYTFADPFKKGIRTTVEQTKDLLSNIQLPSTGTPTDTTEATTTNANCPECDYSCKKYNELWEHFLKVKHQPYQTWFEITCPLLSENFVQAFKDCSGLQVHHSNYLAVF